MPRGGSEFNAVIPASGPQLPSNQCHGRFVSCLTVVIVAGQFPGVQKRFADRRCARWLEPRTVVFDQRRPSPSLLGSMSRPVSPQITPFDRHLLAEKLHRLAQGTGHLLGRQRVDYRHGSDQNGQKQAG